MPEWNLLSRLGLAIALLVYYLVIPTFIIHHSFPEKLKIVAIFSREFIGFWLITWLYLAAIGKLHYQFVNKALPLPDKMIETSEKHWRALIIGLVSWDLPVWIWTALTNILLGKLPDYQSTPTLYQVMLFISFPVILLIVFPFCLFTIRRVIGTK